MPLVSFNTKDAEILYSFPRPPSNIATVVRAFMFLNRTAAPTYKEVVSCLSKSLRVGILHEVDGVFVVDEQWYARIHEADQSAQNEVESMLTFQDSFVGISIAAPFKTPRLLSRADYESVVKALR